jgi:uncharacterized protein
LILDEGNIKLSLLKADKCWIPLSDIKGGKVSVDFLWHSDVLTSEGSFFHPVTVNAEITEVEGNYLADIRSSGRGQFICDRCGEQFVSDISGRVKSLFTFDPEQVKGEEHGDCHLIPASSQRLDITQDALDALFLGIPVKVLCNKDCRGLCGRCGANLNHEQCKCTDGSSDPRWDGLKKLKFDE